MKATKLFFNKKEEAKPDMQRDLDVDKSLMLYIYIYILEWDNGLLHAKINKALAEMILLL